MESLAKILREEGEYRTPENVKKTLGDRLFGSRDLWYHALTLKVVSQGCFWAYAGKFDRKCWSTHGIRAMEVVERCGGVVGIEGGKNLLNLDGPAVFVANHMSMLETLVLPGIVLLHNQASIVVKQSLIERPFFGKIMSEVGALGVGRTDPRQDLKVMLEGGAAALKSGKSLIIFPQSTRLPIFDGSKFNSIGVKIASRAGVPVVPVALKTDFLGVGKLVKDFGPVDHSKNVMFGFGEPMPPTMNRKEIHNKCIEYISNTLLSWGAQLVPMEGAKE
jgi:1-acyl-sn-glycerol-3-phosphate acyltransferase